MVSSLLIGHVGSIKESFLLILPILLKSRRLLNDNQLCGSVGREQSQRDERVNKEGEIAIIPLLP